MNLVNTPPSCESCGIEIHDDGPEQTDAWLAGICEPCHADSQAALRREQFTESCTCTGCSKVMASPEELTDSANSGDFRCLTCQAKYLANLAELQASDADERHYG